MKKIAFYLLLLLLACTNVDESSNNDIIRAVVIYDTDFEKVSYSGKELIDDYYYIPLETIDSSNLIGKIDKIEIYGNKIFVLDKRISKGIFIFDLKGKYLNKIYKIGEGPGEFVQLYDMIVDTSNIQLILYCHKIQKILFYELNGKFIREKKIGISLRSMAYQNGNYMFFTHSIYNYHNKYGDLNYDFIVIDTSMRLINKQFPNKMQLNKSSVVISHGSYFTKNSGDLFISYIFNDTIYKITDKNQAIPFCYFDFGNNSIPSYVFKEKENIYIYKDVVMDGLYWCKYGPLEFTKQLGFINISAGISNEEVNGFYSLIFRRDLTSKILFKEILLEKDDGIFSNPISNMGEYFVSVIYPEELLFTKENNNDETPLFLKGIDYQVNKFDYPLLMFTKFKKIC